MSEQGKSKIYRIYSLKLIPPGEKVEVVHIPMEEAFFKKLKDIGLREGAILEVINRDPFSRKIVLRVGESMLALDEDLVKTVMVTPVVCLYETMKERLYYDLLTGCFKRDFAEDALQSLLRCPPCSFALVDLDDFKKINDTYGHSFGDQVLREVGLTLRRNLRKHDLAVRWGGEEFIIGLPKTPVDLALRICERLRKAIALLQLKWNEKVVPITASFGVCAVPPPRGLSVLLEEADKALYKAKRNGKNRVELYAA
ncbi:MAG: diguanylate cyclase [Desulfurococcaceae archaeon]